MNIEEVYKEVGNNYRHFLDWRTKYLTAYFAIISALGSVMAWLFEKEEKNILWLIAIVGAIITLMIILLEIRTRKLYQSCQKIGMRIEKTNELNGIYTELFKEMDNEKLGNELKNIILLLFKKITTTIVLRALLIVMFLFFLILSCYFISFNFY